MSLVFLFTLIGCTGQLDKEVQNFEDGGVSYEMQLPSSWKKDNTGRMDYGLKTAISGEDTRSNSYMFITTVPVAEVAQEGFGEKTREQLRERYKYKKAKDIFMKEVKINGNPAYKYTLNTMFKEKSVWAQFYYIWTKHGFVQVTFYSADDNSYKKRSEMIDASVETLKEVDYDSKKAAEAQKSQKQEEGDVITIENKEIKMETTGVRKITGEGNKNLLAIRYTFTNLNSTPVEPSIWKTLVTATQNGQELSVGELPQDTSFLDVKELADEQSKNVEKGESLESVAFYELSDDSSVELAFSQEAFPELKPVRVVVPK
ncbi:hypothetical protein RV12_GL002197 [Enterococcus quebecensis]|nr:hypothetical protein RV12_GL002197 [Enterococcus quebecensis]